MKVYIAGKMSGLPMSGFPAFLDAAERLRAHGIEVVSPAEMDLELGFDPENAAQGANVPGYTRADLMVRDMQLIADPTVDGIALLPSWVSSLGAHAERAFTEAIHKGVWHYCPPPAPTDLRTLRPILLRGAGGAADVLLPADEERLLHEGRPA